jgi:N-acetyl-alpha-D-muramate 1-phosphate uridylyltransferase
MRGMILAAGRGSRMGTLTDQTPKPLLRLHGHYLIEYAIHAFVTFGIQEIVINVSYKSDDIKKALGTGDKYGVTFYYSDEMHALETGGGIFKALPLLGKDPFVVLSSDVISSYPLQNLPKNPEGLAHLILVDNPDFNQKGDFSLKGKSVTLNHPTNFTYANIGIFRPELFLGCKEEKFLLGSLLKKAALSEKVTGEYFTGQWHNLGTALQLSQLSEAPHTLPSIPLY